MEEVDELWFFTGDGEFAQCIILNGLAINSIYLNRTEQQLLQRPR